MTKRQSSKAASTAKKEEEEKKATGCKAWDWHDSMIFGEFGETTPSEKIAAFDMDSTLTLTKGTHTFCRNATDWRWWGPSVPKKLKEAHEEGFKIVIITNQNGIGTGKFSAAELKKKFGYMHKDLGVPFQILAATQ